MSIEAMKLALEALEDACGERCNAEHNPCFQREAITALRQAIEQAEQTSGCNHCTHPLYAGTKCKNCGRVTEQAEKQEPVAWRYRGFSPFPKNGEYMQSQNWTLINKPNQRDAHSAMCKAEVEPLYTSPPPRQPWVGLTEEEKSEIYHHQKFVVGFYSPAKFADAIEAKLKEKNT